LSVAGEKVIFPHGCVLFRFEK